MLDWPLFLCIVILAVLIWPGSKYFGTESPRGALFQRQTTAQQATENKPEKRVSDRHEKAAAVALVCKPSALANYLLKHCRTFRNYSPFVGWTWRASALLQSVYEACWPCDSPVQFVRDNLQLSDDGLVALDWAVPSSQKRRRTSSHSTSPVLLIIPNSFGKITRTVLKVRFASLMLLIRNNRSPVLLTIISMYSIFIVSFIILAWHIIKEMLEVTAKQPQCCPYRKGGNYTPQWWRLWTMQVK